MRKKQQQEILELAKTLHEAHEEIKKNLEHKQYAYASDMLVQCQECAVSMGNHIETLEGESFVTITYIQDYCDIIYQIYQKTTQVTPECSDNKAYKMLKRALLKIENSIKNDVHIRKEVAFFPYKASMWDSLESVYLKLKEDSEYDVYCVPIPYYEVNPDRSLGRMHYEGREYPKNIEVIDYRTYNFEERRPDAIYIHNPYDDWNLVTQIDERYFCMNLKKYTEELVYIPYFVLPEIEPDNQAAIDTMKHFINTPAVIMADKVIVQSEKMKQIYVNEYIKWAKETGLQGKHIDRVYQESRILGVGSPKIEKALRTKKEDIEIPDEWRQVIQKPDGTYKKIVFYNTSVGSVLGHSMHYLDKIEDTLKVFYENREQIALIWRPHPLMENTLKSMMPGLLQRYREIVVRYCNAKWGIYDNTPDMHRALALSDAYYGDGSSVLHVYEKLHKPILIQNANILYDGENSYHEKNITDM